MLRNRKSSVGDRINNRLLKYGREDFTAKISKLFQLILKTPTRPQDWKASMTVPIFKEEHKSDPNNYGGITLISAAMKVFPNIPETILDSKIEINEQQQGFCNNRSTTDAI